MRPRAEEQQNPRAVSVLQGSWRQEVCILGPGAPPGQRQAWIPEATVPSSVHKPILQPPSLWIVSPTNTLLTCVSGCPVLNDGDTEMNKTELLTQKRQQTVLREVQGGKDTGEGSEQVPRGPQHLRTWGN